MKRSPGTEAGFISRFALEVSSRLTNAIVVALAIGSLSLCLIVMLAVLSTKVSIALPR
jgi:hypothetical protein